MKKNNFSNMRISKVKLILFLLVSVTLSSCYKERFGLDRIIGGTWDPTLAAPVISSTLTMKDLAKNDTNLWIEYPGGMLGLVYQNIISTDDNQNFVNIIDQTKDTSFTIKFSGGMAVGDYDTKKMNFLSTIANIGNERVDSVLIKNGKIHFEITTNLNQNGNIEILIPLLKANGNADFRVVLPFTYSGGASTTIIDSFPLNEHWLYLLQSGAFSYLNQHIKISIVKGNNPINTAGYTFHMKETIKNLTYYRTHGYFHQHTFNFPFSKMNIDVFDTKTLGQLIMEEPVFRVKARNSYGMPMNINFTKLYVEKDGIPSNITSSILPTIGLPYPTIAYNYADTTLEFNKNNSNIVSLFNLNPQNIFVEANVNTNPLGNTIPNFVLDTSRITLTTELEIPLHGRAMQFSLVDTGDFEIEDVEEIETLDFYVNAYNQFPITAKIQIYLTDANYVILDSVFKSSDNIINAATPGAPPSYRTTGKTHKLTVSTFKSADLRKLNNVKHVIFKTNISTFENGSKIIKIYSDYGVDLKVAIKTKLKVDF